MNIVFVLLPLSLILGGIFFLGYCWCVKTGQFEDLDSPARRMLAEENNRNECRDNYGPEFGPCTSGTSRAEARQDKDNLSGM